ncbi:hypothetical protein GI584_14635 [Gracilibacillus salitolerans]|uniref:Uncharacterized protein n=2 Tax=Gracilibacillus salitolerans TaxID=2663022 RepID=A0A5Q2TMX6_9BACI|nr:hypothetical protein GI584_14635 [Gracilibacillus salitolerans]
MKLQQLTYVFILLTGFSIGIHQAFENNFTQITMIILVIITFILIAKDIRNSSKEK